MTELDTVQLTCEKVRIALADKGVQAGELGPGALLLGGDLPLDSLDLAAIVVELEHTTGRDPFADGFVEFRTIGELAALFDKA